MLCVQRDQQRRGLGPGAARPHGLAPAVVGGGAGHAPAVEPPRPVAAAHPDQAGQPPVPHLPDRAVQHLHQVSRDGTNQIFFHVHKYFVQTRWRGGSYRQRDSI